MGLADESALEGEARMRGVHHQPALDHHSGTLLHSVRYNSRSGATSLTRHLDAVDIEKSRISSYTCGLNKRKF